MTSGREGTMPMLMPRDKPLLMVIDGHAQVYRAWHAIGDRQRLSVSKTGEDTTAVYGFVNAFFRAIQDWSPTHCAIAFDLPTPTFRHLQFPEYKAQRPASPPELRHQFERVKQIMRSFRVPVFEEDGYEADDVIGTLCRLAEESEMETIVLTGDTDTFQLVSPWVRIDLHYSIQNRKIYGETEVRERYGGLQPAQQPDLKALKGDPSDNIPGVPGVGDKTAIKLMLEFDSLEGIYENIDRVTPPKIQEALRSNKERAFKGRELTTIVRNVPVNLDLEESRFGAYDRGDIVKLFLELEFHQAVSRIPDPLVSAGQATEDEPAIIEDSATLEYHLVDTPQALDDMISEITKAGEFAFDTETTNADPMRAALVGLGLSTAPGTAWYVPVGHKEGRQLPLEQVIGKLRPILGDPAFSITAHNGNHDLMVLGNYGISPKNLKFDTMIAGQLVGKKAIALKTLCLDVLNFEMTPISDLIGTGAKQLTMDRVTIEKVKDYACANADITGRLRRALEIDIHEKGFTDLFTQVELPLIPVLVSMQRLGIALEVGTLYQMSRDLQEQLKDVETLIYDLVGHLVNINSPQQLSDLLFNELQLPKTKRRTTGYSTDANALEGIRGAHPVIDKILEYRQLSKLKSTYVDPLPQLVNPGTGRLHTSYNQVGSATGRMSSSDPNLQNIPIRTELGRRIRKSFVAENSPEWVLLSADYSQIELRVLAHLSKDPALVEAFQRGEDVHSATASLMYDVPLAQTTSDMRRIAKVLNFGVIYGLSAYGIAQQTEFSPDEGQKFIDNYFATYPGVKLYIEAVKDQARVDGFVETILNRRRYVPDINVSNHNVRQAAERMAVNMPIQGTAADIMKLAMIRIHNRMLESSLNARMLLQVHDELLFEVPVEETQALEQLVYHEMSHARELIVPLGVDVKSGYNWGEMEYTASPGKRAD